jgi:hypothetical protein
MPARLQVPRKVVYHGTLRSEVAEVSQACRQRQRQQQQQRRSIGRSAGGCCGGGGCGGGAGCGGAGGLSCTLRTSTEACPSMDATSRFIVPESGMNLIPRYRTKPALAGQVGSGRACFLAAQPIMREQPEGADSDPPGPMETGTAPGRGSVPRAISAKWGPGSRPGPRALPRDRGRDRGTRAWPRARGERRPLRSGHHGRQNPRNCQRPGGSAGAAGSRGAGAAMARAYSLARARAPDGTPGARGARRGGCLMSCVPA